MTGVNRRRTSSTLLFVVAVALLTSVLIACDDDDDSDQLQREASESPSPEVTTPLGLTEEEYQEYQDTVDFVLGDVQGFWEATLPAVFNARFVPPESFIAYHSAEGAPMCGRDAAHDGKRGLLQPRQLHRVG